MPRANSSFFIFSFSLLKFQHDAVAQPFGHYALHLAQLVVALEDGGAAVVVGQHGGVLQGAHEVGHLFGDDGILEVNHQEGHQFVEALLVGDDVLVLVVVLAQLVAVAHQLGAELADGGVGVVEEVVLGAEAFGVDALGGLLQHPAVQGVVEGQLVLLQVLDDVFGDSDGHFVAFVVGHVAHDALAVAHHHLEDEPFVTVELAAFLVFLGDERGVVIGRLRGGSRDIFFGRRRRGVVGRGFPVLGGSGTCLCLAAFALALFGTLLGLLLAAFGHFADQQLVLDVQQLGALLDIYVAHDGFGDDGDALHQAADEFGPLDGVAARVFQQEVGLEADEVRLVFADEGLELRAVVLAGKGVGVVAVGQEADFDVHAFFQQHVDAAQRGLDAGGVTVVEHGEVVGEAVYQLDLVGG